MFDKFNGITSREKRLTLTALASLIVYISYLGVIAPTSGMIAESTARLRQLENQISTINGETGTVTGLKKELNELKRELKRKVDIEMAFNRQLKEPGQADSVIKLFEESAGDIRVELTRISIRADDSPRHAGKNSYKFINTLKKVPDSDKDVRDKNSEVVSFRSNKIDLAYRSSYENAIEYLEKLRGLPYAISLLSVNIAPEKVGTDPQRKGKEMVLTTKIGMDIFSR